MIQELLVLIMGNVDNDRPVRLEKREPKMNIKKMLNNWVYRNFGIIALVAIILLFIIFVWVCFTIVGFSGTESGLQYNHFQDIVS